MLAQVQWPASVGNGSTAVEFLLEMVNRTVLPDFTRNTFPDAADTDPVYIGETKEYSFDYDSFSGNVNFTTLPSPAQLPPNMLFSPAPNASSSLPAPGERHLQLLFL